jgi:prophage maintenance system killer protein
MSFDEARGVLDVVRRYERTWRVLLDYDEDKLAAVPAKAVPVAVGLSLDDARNVLAGLRAHLAERGDATGLFGRERGNQLDAILGSLEQTFGGEPLYPTAQARAAHLLYFVIKDHPFSDGNKRIATLLFLEFLHRNRLLLRADGTLRLSQNAQVALTLLIAESEPSRKDLMIRLVLALLDAD